MNAELYSAVPNKKTQLWKSGWLNFELYFILSFHFLFPLVTFILNKILLCIAKQRLSSYLQNVCAHVHTCMHACTCVMCAHVCVCVSTRLATVFITVHYLNLEEIFME